MTIQDLSFVVAPERIGTKRGAIYLRVSTDEQREQGYGLTIQFEECIRYAKQLGYQLVGDRYYRMEAGKLRETTADDPDAVPLYIEDYTGFSPVEDRPTGKLLAEMLRAKQADAVIAHRVDRIARDSLEARIAARSWLRGGIEVHTAKNGRITNDNDIVFLIESWQGQTDYSNIVEKLKEGRHNKAKGGKVVGCKKPTYGYRFLRDARGKTTNFEVYEPEARIVRMIFEWYVSGGISLYGVASKLNDLHVPTPAQIAGIQRIRTWRGKVIECVGQWSRNSVSNIVNNSVYAGIWHYGRKIGQSGEGGKRSEEEQFKVSVPAIVDAATWQRAQNQRQRNKELSWSKTKLAYLLSGRLRCECGRSMSGHVSNHARRYRCTNVSKHEPMKQNSIKADPLEAQVWQAIKRKLTNLDELYVELQAAQHAELNGQDPRRREIESLESMIGEGEQEAVELAASLRRAKGRVLDVLDKQQDELNARLQSYETRRTELVASLSQMNMTDERIGSIMEYAQDLKAGFAHATYEDKRQMLEHLKLTATIQDGKLTSLKGVLDFCTTKRSSAKRLRRTSPRR